MSSKTRESNEARNKDSKDEEDVPADFFDDFADDDFLDGLDIVDAWDEKEKEDAKARKSKPNEKETSKPKDEKRRDPAKTKRDIEKDKEKSDQRAKSKEKQLINERLKVAETGLVPPGMELEYLDEIQTKTKELETQIKKAISPTKEREMNKTRSRSNKPSQERRWFSKINKQEPQPSNRNRSPGSSRDRSSRDRSSRNRSSRNRSSRDRSLRNRGSRDRSLRDRGSRDRSLRDRGSRDRNLRDRGSRDRNLRDRGSRDRNLRDRGSRDRSSRDRSWENFRKEIRKMRYSPIYSKKRSRSRSPSFDRRSRNKRVPSSSPERKYHFKNMDKKKLSFLEQLQRDLQGRPAEGFVSGFPYANPVAPYAMNSMVPDPVPPPGVMSNMGYNQYPMSQNTLYDQNFFIGNDTIQPVAPVVAPTVAPIDMPFVPVPTYVQPTEAPKMSDAMSKLIDNLLTPKKVEPVDTKTEQVQIKQLFEEKKISLSDFLTMTSKPEVQAIDPEELKKKIQVISRCQDIIKELGEVTQYNGKLKVTSKILTNPEPRVQNVSPLLRKKLVQYEFTTAPSVNENSSFEGHINNLLRKTGLEPIELIDIDKPPEVPKPNHMMIYKSTQTDTVRCEECFKRKGIIKFSVGTQCAEKMSDATVQVCEADIVMETMPQNQSLAVLTPAQLMGRTEKNRMEAYPPQRVDPYQDDMMRQRAMFAAREIQTGVSNVLNRLGPQQPNRFFNNRQPNGPGPKQYGYRY